MYKPSGIPTFQLVPLEKRPARAVLEWMVNAGANFAGDEPNKPAGHFTIVQTAPVARIQMRCCIHWTKARNIVVVQLAV